MKKSAENEFLRVKRQFLPIHSFLALQKYAYSSGLQKHFW